MMLVVVRISYRTTSDDPSHGRVGRGLRPLRVLGHYFAGLTHRQLWAGMTRCFPVSALPARRTRYVAAFCNFCRFLTGWSFGALLQACKQSSRRFTQGFHPLLSAAVHGSNHEPGAIGNVRIQSGEIRNVEC